jgi:hypothetical protein
MAMLDFLGFAEARASAEYEVFVGIGDAVGAVRADNWRLGRGRFGVGVGHG